MRKSKLWITLSVLLSIIISFVAGIYFASSDNISNKQKGYQNRVFNSGDLALEGWQQSNDSFVTASSNSSITLNNINSFVNNIYFDGTLNEAKCKSVIVYYTTNPNEKFSEQKVLNAAVEQKGNKLFFSVNKNVSGIKIQPYEATGLIAKIKKIEVNPTAFNFSFGIIFSIMTVLLTIIAVISFFAIYLKSFRGFMVAFNKYKFLLKNLIQRDLKVKYRRSALGIMWSVLNPLLMMLVISAVFANVFKFDIKDFPIYYITGAWIFNFVSEATSTSLTAVIGAAPLIKKVYIPKYIFPLEKCMFSLVNMLFSLIAVAIVFLMFRVQLHFTILLIPLPIIYSLVFSIGLSLILAAINVFFRDVGHLYAVWITAWMYFTPIIYPISALPKAMANILKLNPMYYYVEYARDVMIYGNIPTLQQNLICFGFSFITLIIGLLVFKKKQDKFILYI